MEFDDRVSSEERPDHRLVGWKDIAAYVGVSVATARRWGMDRGLPVHRIQGASGASVFASTAEIDAWFVSSEDGDQDADRHVPSRSTPSRRVWIAALLGLGAVVTFAIYAYDAAAPGGQPTTARLVDRRHWVVEDVAGNELWRRSWAEPLRDNLPKAGEVTDLDGDGTPEIIVVVAHAEPPDRVGVYAVDGTERWSFTPGTRLTLDGNTYDDRYQIQGLVVLETVGDEKRIAVSSHHRLYHPARVDVLDHTGAPVCGYVHGGWITAMAPFQLDDDPGDELALGTINNALGRPTLGVLDVPCSPGFSPGITTASQGLRSGLELAYLALPRTRTSAVVSDHSWVEWIVPTTRGGLSVQVNLDVGGDSPNGEYTYDLGPGLHFERARFTDLFRSVHGRLRAAGTIDFPLAEEVTLGPPEWLVGAPRPHRPSGGP